MLIIPFAHNHNSLCLWSYRYHDSLRFQEPAPDVLQNWTWPRSDPSNVTSRLESCVVRSLQTHSNPQGYFSIEITIGLLTKTFQAAPKLFYHVKATTRYKDRASEGQLSLPPPLFPFNQLWICQELCRQDSCLFYFFNGVVPRAIPFEIISNGKALGTRLLFLEVIYRTKIKAFGCLYRQLCVF